METEQDFMDSEKLLENTPALIYEIDLITMRFINANKLALEYFGYSREELENLTPSDILPPEEQKNFLRGIQGLKGETAFFERMEHRVLRKGGREGWLLMNKKFFFEGEIPVRVRGVAYDISQHRKTEEENLVASKEESLSLLAGGLAHDFNNILTIVMGNLSLARAEMGDATKLGKRLKEIEVAALEAQHLTNQLQSFSRNGAPVKKPINLSNLVTDMVCMALSGSNVKGAFSLDPNLKEVEADSGQISQVISNLAINAVQAMPEGGNLQVRAENIMVGRNDLLPLLPGCYVKLTIADQGHGIKAENLGKIFDPYFTTKKTGNGLGLATAHAIVRRHRGHIGVTSKPGSGTTFQIYLPACKQIAGPKPVAEAEIPLMGSGRILVMDDKEGIRSVLGEMLEILGYQTDFACDGEQVLNMYMKAQGVGIGYKAVLLDLTVPGAMGAKETVRKLHKLEPNAKAIVVSGYCNAEIMRKFGKYGFVGCINKPCKLEELSQKLSGILEPGRKEGARCTVHERPV